MFSCLSVACLHAKGRDIAALIAFLRTWNNPRITSFEVYLTKSALESAGQLYEVLAAHCVHEHLHSFVIGINPKGGVSPITQHPGHFFRPLFSFTQLRFIEVQVLNGYDLDDGIITEMARAWRNLERLQLRSHSTYQSRCTLLSLGAFAQYCPRLQMRRFSHPISRI